MCCRSWPYKGKEKLAITFEALWLVRNVGMRAFVVGNDFGQGGKQGYDAGMLLRRLSMAASGKVHSNTQEMTEGAV